LWHVKFKNFLVNLLFDLNQSIRLILLIAKRVCLFCITVKNRVYVLEVEMLEPVRLARNLQFAYTMLLDDICQLVENPNRELIKRAFKDI
jgi:hypothetical protein